MLVDILIYISACMVIRKCILYINMIVQTCQYLHIFARLSFARIYDNIRILTVLICLRGVKMGTLKYAILGLLRRNNLTGYEISKKCEASLFEFWHARHSQIYPELKALYEAGFIDYHVAITGNVLEKKVYSITARGIDEFTAWAEADIKNITVPKDEFRLQLYFSDCIEPHKRLELLKNKLLLHRERYLYLQEKLQEFGNPQQLSEVEFCDYMVMQNGMMREQYLCIWLRQCLKLCKSRLGGA